jgi:hypothetical protein
MISKPSSSATTFAGEYTIFPLFITKAFIFFEEPSLSYWTSYIGLLFSAGLSDTTLYFYEKAQSIGLLKLPLCLAF